MIIEATAAAIALWNSINDETARSLLEDVEFMMFEHDCAPNRIRICGMGTHMGGGDARGFGPEDNGAWLDRKYWVNGDLDQTFKACEFRWPSY